MLKHYNSATASTLAGIFVCLSALTFLSYAIAHPVYNWDMLGYVASILSITDNNPVTIHAAVYSGLANYVDAESFTELTSSTQYRQVMYEEAGAFAQQIPFYKIRVLFLFIIKGVSALGVDLFQALHLVSATLGTASLLVIYFGLRRYIHPLFWLLIPWLFYRFTHDLIILCHGGVDMLAFFWLSVVSVLYVNKFRYLLWLLPIGIVIRTDLIIFVGLMLFLLYATRELPLRQLVLCAVVSLVLYLATNTWAGNYGWKAIVFFVFVSDMIATHPQNYAKIGFSVKDYLGFLQSPIGWISKLGYLAATGCMASGSYWLYTRRRTSRTAADKPTTRLVYLSFVAIAYMLFHYLLFPALLMRFFVTQLLFMALATLAVASALLAARQQSARPK